MPYTDNEWGDWDESQYDVPPRPKWLEKRLSKNEDEPRDNTFTSLIKPLQKEVSLLPPKKSYSPSLRDFRCWYLWARETGRHERYLQKIEALAIDFKIKTPNAEIDIDLINPDISLSEAHLHNMRIDQRNYQELLKQFLRDAKTILEKRGKRLVGDDQRPIQYQSRNGEYLLSYYPALDRVVVKKDNFLLAYQQTGQVNVGDRFARQVDFALFRDVAEH